MNKTQRRPNRRTKKPPKDGIPLRFETPAENRLTFRDVDLFRIERLRDKDTPPGFPFVVIDGSQVVAFACSEKVAQTLMMGLWLHQLVRKETSAAVRLVKARLQDAFSGSP